MPPCLHIEESRGVISNIVEVGYELLQAWRRDLPAEFRVGTELHLLHLIRFKLSTALRIVLHDIVNLPLFQSLYMETLCLQYVVSVAVLIQHD